MNTEALKDLLYKIADDQLILGHRNSEWTGFGPLLEEDIAFSSMAQDKVGQSWQIYKLLEELGESEPDMVAFMRNADQFHNCQLVELPNGEYDFSLIRHFLFDMAEQIRFTHLASSSYEPLSLLAKKIKGEIKYHTMHAKIWMKQLGSATEESVSRLQNSLEEAMPYALGIFEPSKFEAELIKEDIFRGEEVIKEEWIEQISAILKETSLKMPDLNSITPVYGGRYGKHTEHLQPLLDEMSEVFKMDPTADW
ncbi:ring-1,2-phenylacetyl-CoA epoxidase subunit PaaC [Roseivirga ehrenbergii]|uniref:Phenylacetate-CoA oxygenase n=1 Tax=Roseivirga ehrenbergii (strain DSM 102268 / JCM 13514 / KCTC 12282 / NCIMB 14502 / KMM 6017) TaxID=279360 RepID=A0A150XTG5_ROSEK|nr:1,2-phenylacetyl-CoA epoxidase subunit PaaC [Roseivirga ehrenbergii]KYG82013.1 phenylacetate-CoA oxygenase [Roseivirga ehrenbergii]TCL01834.1 ring-1,2-phenylacetyl-CoA epoxidase subunit PaaC [Roseivirga ehrenbergii]